MTTHSPAHWFLNRLNFTPRYFRGGPSSPTPCHLHVSLSPFRVFIAPLEPSKFPPTSTSYVCGDFVRQKGDQRERASWPGHAAASPEEAESDPGGKDAPLTSGLQTENSGNPRSAGPRRSPQEMPLSELGNLIPSFIPQTLTEHLLCAPSIPDAGTETHPPSPTRSSQVCVGATMRGPGRVPRAELGSPASWIR